MLSLKTTRFITILYTGGVSLDIYYLGPLLFTSSLHAVRRILPATSGGWTTILGIFLIMMI
jgi:hypothetical protein